MKLRIKSPENFWSGLMFIGIGVFAVVLSRDYARGEAMRMGPGYFPTALGSILTVLGAIIIATSFKFEGEGIEPFAWRPVILLMAAFALFGWAIDHVGFIAAMFALIVVSAASTKEFKWGEVLIMSLALIAGSWALFLWGLGLPFPLICWR